MKDWMASGIKRYGSIPWTREGQQRRDVGFGSWFYHPPLTPH